MPPQSVPPPSRELVPGFAEMLRAARERRGWTQTELAERAGVSQVTACEVERGRRAPSLRVASALVRALGLIVHLDAPATPIGTRES